MTVGFWIMVLVLDGLTLLDEYTNLVLEVVVGRGVEVEYTNGLEVVVEEDEEDLELLYMMIGFDDVVLDVVLTVVVYGWRVTRVGCGLAILVGWGSSVG